MKFSRRMDEFELGPILGVGTAGTIYEAHDKSHDRQVALKILLASVSEDEVIQARFEREMLILEKLSHPNIVRYFGGGRRDGQLFFAMELLTAGSLKDELARNGAFSWIEAATCGEQIASALQHAHNHGIIHRDLKPSNLLFDNEGTLKLVDFGIARDTHEADITNQGLTVGSHAYMSPEQITGDRTITGQTDLYSLGVLLYELLAGHPPFSGDNFAQLFHQHLNTPPRPLRAFLPAVPAAMEQLVLRLLAKRPEQRPANARVAQGVLRGLLSEAFPAEASASDVPASHAVDMGRRVMSQRLTQSPNEVSWATLGGLAVAAGTLIWAAWYFGA